MNMRLTFLILLLLSCITTKGQSNPTILDADFQMNGTMTLFWETEDPQNISNADEGCKWHLEQKKENGKRIVTFWIDMSDPKLKQLNKTTWKDAVVTMVIVEDKKKMYVVRDYQFRHLTIMEYDKEKYLVQLCSIVEDR